MSKRTYEEYIKNGCHPVGYNEPCQSYYFAQSSVDLLLDKIDQLKQELAEKDKEIERLRQIINTIQQNIRQYNKEDYEDKQLLYKDIDMLKQNQTQLAIQELEKVKDYISDCTYIKEPDYTNVRCKIDQQIKELKGE